MTFVTPLTSIPRVRASDATRTCISPFLKAFSSLLHAKSLFNTNEQSSFVFVRVPMTDGTREVRFRYYLRTDWLRPPEYSFAFIFESPKKLSNLHRRRVVSTEDVKMILFSPSHDFKRATKYTGFIPVSQIC